MQAILLFGHGSVLCGAERNLLDLARAMEADGAAAIVEAAFLSYTPPDLETALARCVEREAATVAIVPWFLVAGKFVVEELPGRIGSVLSKFPEIEIVVAEPIRAHPGLADAILACAERVRRPAEWRALAAVEAAASCRNDPRCPLYGSPQCPRAALAPTPAGSP
ncbi:MAG TPA: CbiX/SirB N-terminal domain-containing protein [Thermoanaerobaculia bacterium]|nr:CbiX/SirB N-terminal domain-containing protein [Thermoanaerobaculia bacterium]